MGNFLLICLIVIILLFPIWVAIQAYRKDYTKLAALIGLSYFFPTLPFFIAVVVFFVVRAYEPEWYGTPELKSYVGCGTRFYGSSKRESDGSVITTQWFTFLMVPLIPIQSYRVIRGNEKSDFMGYVISSTIDFSIIENLRIYWWQVIQTYIFLFAYVGIVVGSIIDISKNTAPEETGPLVGAVISTCTVVFMGIGYFLFRVRKP